MRQSADLYDALMTTGLGNRRTVQDPSFPSFNSASAQYNTAPERQLSNAQQWALQNIGRNDQLGQVAMMILQESGLVRPQGAGTSFAPTSRGPSFGVGGNGWDQVAGVASSISSRNQGAQGGRLMNGVANTAAALGAFQTGPTNDPTGQRLQNLRVGAFAAANTFQGNPDLYRLAVASNAVANFQRPQGGASLTTRQQFQNLSIGFDAVSRMSTDNEFAQNAQRAALGASAMRNFNFGQNLTAQQQWSNVAVGSQVASLIPNQGAQRLATGAFGAAQIGAHWNNTPGTPAGLGNAALAGGVATSVLASNGLLTQRQAQFANTAVTGLQTARTASAMASAGTSMASVAGAGMFAGAGLAASSLFGDYAGSQYVNTALNAVGMYSQLSAMGAFGGSAATTGAAATAAGASGGAGSAAAGTGLAISGTALAWTGVGAAAVVSYMAYRKKMQNMHADHGTAQNQVFGRLDFKFGQQWDPNMSAIQQNLTNALAGAFDPARSAQVGLAPGQKLDSQTFAMNMNQLFMTAAGTTGGVDKLFHDTRNQLNNLHKTGKLTDSELVDACRTLASCYEGAGTALLNAAVPNLKQSHALRTKNEQLDRQVAGMVDSLNDMLSDKGISTQITRTANSIQPKEKKTGQRTAAQWA